MGNVSQRLRLAWANEFCYTSAGCVPWPWKQEVSARIPVACNRKNFYLLSFVVLTTCILRPLLAPPWCTHTPRTPTSVPFLLGANQKRRYAGTVSASVPCWHWGHLSSLHGCHKPTLSSEVPCFEFQTAVLNDNTCDLCIIQNSLDAICC